MISFKVRISQIDIFLEWKIPQNSISNLLWPFCLQLLPIGNLAVVAFYLETCSQETLISKWSPALGILCFCVQCIFSQQKGPFWPCMCDWDILFKKKTITVILVLCQNDIYCLRLKKWSSPHLYRGSIVERSSQVHDCPWNVMAAIS